MIVIGHRGACGYRPEHTLASYALAAEMGADYIEPDLVLTRDGFLVARHEPEIGGTTDVASRPEFADRFGERVLDGVPRSGWWVDDFTLKELRTLRAVERLPELRPSNTEYDGRWGVPTFDEVLALAADAGVAVIPETKHPTYFAGRGLSFHDALVAALAGFAGPAIVQSFEVENLLALRAAGVRAELMQLFAAPDRSPVDRPAVSYAALEPDWATWVGVPIATALSAGFVARQHAAGRRVAAFTYRAEHQSPGEFRACWTAGVDAMFTDHPDVGVASRRSVTSSSP